MSKVAGSVLKVVGIAALVVGTVATGGALLAGASFGAALGGTVTIAGVGLGSISSILAVGALANGLGGSLLAAGKAAKAARTARANNLIAQVNPNAPLVLAFGETALPLQVGYAENIGDKRVVQILVGAAHEIDSVSDLWIDDELVTFSGASATGKWASSVKRYTRLGTETQSALTISGLQLPASARGRGVPYFALEWQLDGSAIKDRIPTRITQKAKCCLCYDPRKDSTQPGGAGAHRADDQTTWEFSENWALINLFYLLGWKINNKLVVGRGIDPADIDMASFIACANVCDTIEDGKPKYHIGGMIEIDGDHARVTAELEATVGGKVTRSGGLFKIWAPHDDLVPVASITEDDLVEGIDPIYQPSARGSQPYNTAGGKYVEPDLLYQFESYPEVTEDSAKTADGKERFMPFDTPYLQDATRAQRVARQQVRRSRFSGTWTLAVGYKFLSLEEFDVVTINLLSTNYNDVMARVDSKVVSAKGIIVLTLVAEDSSIYDLSAPLAPAPTRIAPPTLPASDVVVPDEITAEIVQNDFFNQGTKYWQFTSGFSHGETFHNGGLRRGMRHDPVIDDFEFWQGKPGAAQKFKPGARIWNKKFDTAPGERIEIAFYGKAEPGTDGLGWVGISYYREDGSLIRDQIAGNPVEPDPNIAVDSIIGGNGRTLTTPAETSYGIAFFIIRRHTAGVWWLVGCSHTRIGISAQSSVLDGNHAPADPNATEGAPTGTNVAGRAAEDVEADAGVGRALTQNNSTVLDPSSVVGVADLTNYSDGRVSNALITLNTDGTASFDPGTGPINLGAVTITGLGFSGDLNADVTNYGDGRVSNGQIVVNADGTVSYDPGSGPVNLGAVTITGLGYTGALNATRNTGALADSDNASWITGGTVGAKTLKNGTATTKIEISGLIGGLNPTSRAVFLQYMPMMMVNAGTSEELEVEFRKFMVGATTTPVVIETRNFVVTDNEYPAPISFTYTATGDIDNVYSFGIKITAVDATYDINVESARFNIWQNMR